MNWNYFRGETSRTRAWALDMRKRQAFSSPEVTGLGADALIRGENTDGEADYRGCISQGTLG